MGEHIEYQIFFLNANVSHEQSGREREIRVNSVALQYFPSPLYNRLDVLSDINKSEFGVLMVYNSNQLHNHSHHHHQNDLVSK